MRILLDHCVPRPFAPMIVGHEARTTEDMGWQEEANGRLLALAGAAFDVFLTVDKSLAHQQNRTDLPLPVVVLRCRSNSIVSVAVHLGALLRLLDQGLQHRVYVLEEPREGRDRR